MAAPKGHRPPGGSRKGIPNKATAKREAEVKASGLTPLDWMLKVLRDPQQPDGRRDDMAKAAAPYVHPKLATTTLQGDPDKPLHQIIEERIVDPHPDR